MNHRVRENITDSGSTMKRNSWMEIESLRKGWEGGEKQRQLETDETTPEIIQRMILQNRRGWNSLEEKHTGWKIINTMTPVDKN